MHVVSFVKVALLAFATSSWAIQITQPALGDTWTSGASNTVSWTVVSTDPTTFALTLVQSGVFKQTLVDSVDATKGSISISTNLPTGSTFQVNAVKSSQSQDINTILAQSAQFNITQGGSSSGASSISTTSGSLATSSSTGSGASSAAASATTAGASGSLDTNLPNASSTSLNPTASHSNAVAALSVPSHSGLMGLLGLFGLALI